jgi:hypothetical protein
MALWMVTYAVFAGLRAWDPFTLEAAGWLGAGVAARGTAGALFIGILLHFLVLAALGVVFGLGAARFLAGEKPTRHSAWGFVYGAAIWLLARAGALPAPHPTAAGRVAPWAFAVGLLLYGSFAGSYVGCVAGEASRPGRRG